MIKRIALLLLFWCYCPVAFAGFWSAVGACFTDPCNCGDSNSTRYENWDGQRWNKGKKNTLCPPWNKNGGRDNNICLVKASFPGAGIGYYENLCGEETPESSYFNPKIRVRGQQCNAVACWTTNNTLNWDGECVTLAGGYGLPLHRMCARIALPRDDIRGFAEDPGYTKDQHLNFEGATKNDEPIYGNGGTEVDLDSPKLCIYQDPSFFSFEDGFDVMDLNPNKQSYHKTSEVHPIIKVIQFFVKAASGIAQSPFDLLSSLFGLMDNGEDGETTFGSVLKDLFSFLGDIIEWVGDLLITFLDEIGQINRAVDDKVYGCVNLPLGPFPPPFCEQVAPFFQVATTQTICHIGDDGFPAASVSGKECVVSNVNNSFIRNSLRVGYETLVPLCREGENPMTTDKCVVLENLGAFSSAQGMHASTAMRDIIKHCDAAAPGAVCVRTMLPHQCSVTSNGCQDGFRVVYGTKLGNSLTPKPYFHDDLADCPSSSSATCQDIWGINTGEFIDVTLSFPSIQTAYDISPLTKNFTLADKGGRTAYFHASIVRIPGFNSAYSFTQETNQLCVFEGDFVVGCRDRVPHSRPRIYDCGSTAVPGISCTTSYFAPKFIVSYKEGGDQTSALIEPQSVYNASSTINSVVNLAGDAFSSFVTDDTFAVKPFSGANAPNPASLFGVYQDNILPVVGSTVNPDAVYLSGLEYINGSYHLGGRHACLEGEGLQKCPDNPEICVLTKLLNKDIVRCSIVTSKSAQHFGLSLCTVGQAASCPVIDSMTKTAGGTVNIRDCGSYTKCYDGNVELCKLSSDPADRHIPSASLGNVLSDSQYYNPSASSHHTGSPPGVAINYDADQYGLRSKTAVEMGLCTTIPQATCAEQNDYSEDNGYARWPSVALGEISRGTCRPGWHAVRPLKRHCIPFPDTKTFGFEPLYRVKYGVFGIVYNEYTDVKCVEDD